jgi:hypothetical protein
MLQTVQAAVPGDMQCRTRFCAWYREGLDYVRGFGPAQRRRRWRPPSRDSGPRKRSVVRRELAKSAKAWRGKWLDARPSEQIDERLDKALDNVKTWYGSASAGANGLAAQPAGSRHPMTRHWAGKSCNAAMPISWRPWRLLRGQSPEQRASRPSRPCWSAAWCHPTRLYRHVYGAHHRSWTAHTLQRSTPAATPGPAPLPGRQAGSLCARPGQAGGQAP